VVAGHDLPYVFVRASAKVRNTRARGRQVDDFGVVWRGTKVALLMLPAHLSVHTSKGVSGGKLLDPPTRASSPRGLVPTAGVDVHDVRSVFHWRWRMRTRTRV